jgi:hypothetical protein
MLRHALLAALALVGVLLVWPFPRARFTAHDYFRVRPGMTRTDVYAILGPPGDFRTRAESFDASNPWCAELALEARTDPDLRNANKEEWNGDGGYIAVCFDAAGRATYKYHVPKVGKLDPLLARVQLVLRELLQPWFSD